MHLRHRTARPLLAAGTVVLGIGLLAGCSSTDDTDSHQTAAPGCASVDGPLIQAGGAADQPTVRVPQPSGWDRVGDAEQAPVTLALANRNLAVDGFAPNLVVTEVPSQGSFDAIIENEMQQLRSMTPTVPTGQKGTLCGFDSYTVTYPGPPQENVPAREVTSRLVVVPTAGDSSTTVVMTVQAINAQDQTYRADTAKMLDGVQISPAQ